MTFKVMTYSNLCQVRLTNKTTEPEPTDLNFTLNWKCCQGIDRFQVSGPKILEMSDTRKGWTTLREHFPEQM